MRTLFFLTFTFALVSAPAWADAAAPDLSRFQKRFERSLGHVIEQKFASAPATQLTTQLPASPARQSPALSSPAPASKPSISYQFPPRVPPSESGPAQ